MPNGRLHHGQIVWALVAITLLPRLFAQEPKLAREDIEWIRVWVPGVNHTDRPHVLLIGDSITEAYSAEVEKQLGTGAYVAKLTTSKSLGDPAFLEEVGLVLGNAKFEVIHFNNGMHGSGYTESEYRGDYPKLLELLKKHDPGVKIICATTTPKRTRNQLNQMDPFTERIKVRNGIAQELAHENKMLVDDLYALVLDHPEFYGSDGTHFKDMGIQAQGRQVAQMIESALKSQTTRGTSKTP
jgi:hypothetical protein